MLDFIYAATLGLQREMVMLVFLFDSTESLRRSPRRGLQQQSPL